MGDSELKSKHKEFYQTLEDFISVSCIEILPKGVIVQLWDSTIRPELEFASQFFLLETSYWEPKMP